MPERKMQFDLTEIGGDRMLTIFDRGELTIAFDMKRQAEVRDLLAQNGIDYSVSVINRKSPSPFSCRVQSERGKEEICSWNMSTSSISANRITAEHRKS